MSDPLFTWRTGFAYRWWRRIRLSTIITGAFVLAMYVMFVGILCAWIFDLKPWW